ncbi:MFS general substrate transporter [Stipitochalara longipes BDJ]|nr:MFS general substrate transporter [Stipitochalara longipes BDJ]
MGEEMPGCFLLAVLYLKHWFGVNSYEQWSAQIADVPAGFPFSFGVFEIYYTDKLPFSQHPNGIAAIGTLSSGGMYLIAPLTLYILEAWPSTRRLSSILGLVVVVTALVASSFSTQVWHLILTQGCLYAVGGSFLYAPTMFYLDEWFVLRKGLAFGIMWAGVGTAGVIFPFILTAFLNAYGFATTLRIWAIVMLVLCAPLIYFVKPRLPVPSAPLPRQRISYAFLTTRTHLALQLCNILEGLGFFLPAIYLPSYAQSLNLPTIAGTVLLATINIFSVFGSIGMGVLCDHLQVTTVIAISTTGATLSVFLLWGFATKLPLLIAFAATYGFFAGGFSAIWSGMMKEVQGVSRDAKMGTLMGLFAAGRGVGAVLSGPVSEVLLNKYHLGVVGAQARFGYQTKYGVLIVFTGISAVLGLLCFGAKKREPE